MTDVLDPPVATRHAVLGFTDGLGAALDRLSDVPAWSLSVAEQREALVSLARAEARVAELRLRVLVAADRDALGVESGATSTASWVAQETGATRASVAADLRLAVALDDG
ncbi:MAG: hypothetical protein H0V42_02050, partial [Nocardioidaceae bacterium]|nr:hypothetical protein [Nocardioidaceae bacterium]